MQDLETLKHNLTRSRDLEIVSSSLKVLMVIL